jgi:hypothetical protein
MQKIIVFDFKNKSNNVFLTLPVDEANINETEQQFELFLF